MNQFRPTITIHSTEIADKTRVHASGFMGETDMILPFTPEEIRYSYRCWQDGDRVQQAFHYLSPEQREFFLTGMSLDDQEEVFGE